MKPLLALALVASVSLSRGAEARPATSTYDIATYRGPAGYAIGESTALLRKLTKVTGRTYCVVTLLAALPSAGGAQQDFDAEWALTGKQLTLGPATSSPGAGPAGWNVVVGDGTFAQGANRGLARLTTFSDGARRFSVLLLTNKLAACAADYRALVASVVLPAGSAPAAPAPAPTAPAGAIRFPTTTFQEGWTATQRPDWVELTRGATTVRLHYAVAFTDDTRRMDPTTRLQHWWNLLVAARYRTANLAIAPTEAGVGMSTFGEAEATEVGTGRAVHVALLSTSENGSAYVIEVVAPDAAGFRAQFATYDQIKAMTGFNKFQVDPAELRGTWENSAAAYGMYYATGDGSFAGMRGASVYDKFTFDGDRYVYEALGVSTGGGTATVQQGTVKGRFGIDAWTATATATDGKVTRYAIQYEAIRGGRLLVLQNTQYSALRYVLAKTRSS